MTKNDDKWFMIAMVFAILFLLSMAYKFNYQ